MADVKQQSTVTKGGIPGGNPMNLTCAPVTGVTGSDASSAANNAPTKYAIVMNSSGPAEPPNPSWTGTTFTSTEAYVVTENGAVLIQVPAGGLGIYSK